MKQFRLIALVALSFIMLNCNAKDKAKNTEKSESGVIYLDADQFKKLVFDFENNKEWKYEGDKPAILDFYADWCGPCKMLAPHLEEIQKAYGDKLQVYKINTDKQQELAQAFGIRSLPTIVMVPTEGQPQAAMGYRDLNALKDMIKESLKVELPE